MWYGCGNSHTHTKPVKLGGDYTKPEINYTIKLAAYTFNTSFVSVCANLKVRRWERNCTVYYNRLVNRCTDNSSGFSAYKRWSHRATCQRTYLKTYNFVQYYQLLCLTSIDKCLYSWIKFTALGITGPKYNARGGWLVDGVSEVSAAALKLETARTSETLVNFYQTSSRYNLEYSHLLRTHAAGFPHELKKRWTDKGYRCPPEEDYTTGCTAEHKSCICWQRLHVLLLVTSHQFIFCREMKLSNLPTFFLIYFPSLLDSSSSWLNHLVLGHCIRVPFH